MLQLEAVEYFVVLYERCNRAAEFLPLVGHLQLQHLPSQSQFIHSFLKEGFGHIMFHIKTPHWFFF